MSDLFNEESLRADVVEKWGPAGAHVDVLDHLIQLARERASMEIVEDEVWCQYNGNVHADSEYGLICSTGHWHGHSLDGCRECPGPHLSLYSFEKKD